MNDRHRNFFLPAWADQALIAMASGQGVSVSEMLRRLVVQAAPLYLSGLSQQPVVAVKLVTASGGEAWWRAA